MLCRVVAFVIDPEHDGDVFTFGGRGDEDFLRTAPVDVSARLGGIREQDGRLDPGVDAEVLPWQLPGIAFREHVNSLAVDRERSVPGLYGAAVDAVVAVELEEVRALLRVDEVVDRSDLDRRMPLHDRLGKVSSDAAEAVDPDAHGSAFTGLLSRSPARRGDGPRAERGPPACC